VTIRGSCVFLLGIDSS